MYIPTYQMGRRQVVRHGVLIPAFAGSNPAGPAKFNLFYLKVNI